MAEIHPDFPPAARRVLSALVGFDPPWRLSGRAALWRWLSSVPRLIGQLDFVWHGVGPLDALHEKVVRTLADAGLDMATLQEDSKRFWLAAGYGHSACALSLRATPGRALAPPGETRLAGVAVTVEALREVIAATVSSLHERPDLQDLENAGLLLRNGVSLRQGLEDACGRNPDLEPLELAQRLACFEIAGQDLSEFAVRRLRRYRESVVVEILAWAAEATIPERRSSRSPRAAH